MVSAGDLARRDEDGYFWIIGRIDDVIKVSGYRLGTAEIESALGSHPAVAESAVIGLPDEIKGQVIHAFVILKNVTVLQLTLQWTFLSMWKRNGTHRKTVKG